MRDVWPPKPIGPTVSLLASSITADSTLGKARIGIGVVERAEELLLRVKIAGRAIAADTHANSARAAALSLRLPDGVEDAFAHAFKGAIGAAQVLELRWQRILRVRVLAAAALEYQLHLDVGGASHCSK